MGYNKQQLKDLQETINRSNCDIVIDGSPVNLKRLIETNKEIVNISYELDKESVNKLKNILKRFI